MPGHSAPDAGLSYCARGVRAGRSSYARRTMEAFPAAIQGARQKGRRAGRSLPARSRAARPARCSVCGRQAERAPCSQVPAFWTPPAGNRLLWEDGAWTPKSATGLPFRGAQGEPARAPRLTFGGVGAVGGEGVVPPTLGLSSTSSSSACSTSPPATRRRPAALAPAALPTWPADRLQAAAFTRPAWSRRCRTRSPAPNSQQMALQKPSIPVPY